MGAARGADEDGNGRLKEEEHEGLRGYKQLVFARLKGSSESVPGGDVDVDAQTQALKALLARPAAE